MGRIRQGIAQVAVETIGNLAGPFIHLAAKPILAAVRYIRDDRGKFIEGHQFHELMLDGSFSGHGMSTEIVREIVESLFATLRQENNARCLSRGPVDALQFRCGIANNLHDHCPLVCGASILDF